MVPSSQKSRLNQNYEQLLEQVLAQNEGRGFQATPALPIKDTYNEGRSASGQLEAPCISANAAPAIAMFFIK